MNFARVSFCMSYKFVNTVEGSFFSYNQSCRCSDRCANCRVVSVGVFAFALMGEHCQFNGYHAEGMTIGFSISSFNHTSYAATIGFVYGNKFAASQFFLNELDNATSRGISTATGSFRNNYGDVAVSRISSFFSVAAAACNHYCHSQQCHQNYKNLFHLSTLLKFL